MLSTSILYCNKIDENFPTINSNLNDNEDDCRLKNPSNIDDIGVVVVDGDQNQSHLKKLVLNSVITDDHHHYNHRITHNLNHQQQQHQPNRMFEGEDSSVMTVDDEDHQSRLSSTVSLTSKPMDGIRSKSIPIRFRVQYLGSHCCDFRSHKPTNGLRSFQKPLLDLYCTVLRKSIILRSLMSLDQVADLSTHGIFIAEKNRNSIRMQSTKSESNQNQTPTTSSSNNCEKNRRTYHNETIVRKVITPLNNIILWAAVRFQHRIVRKRIRKSSFKRTQIGVAFVPLSCSDAALDKNTFVMLDSRQKFLLGIPHPSLFVCVLQKINSIKRLECHLFVCGTSEDAIRMCYRMNELRQQSSLIGQLRVPAPGHMGEYSYRNAFRNCSNSINSSRPKSLTSLLSIRSPVPSSASSRISFISNPIPNVLTPSISTKSLTSIVSGRKTSSNFIPNEDVDHRRSQSKSKSQQKRLLRLTSSSPLSFSTASSSTVPHFSNNILTKLKSNKIKENDHLHHLPLQKHQKNFNDLKLINHNGDGSPPRQQQLRPSISVDHHRIALQTKCDPRLFERHRLLNRMNPSNGKKIDQKTQPSSISSVSGASGSTISNPSSEAMIAQRDYRYEAYKSPTLLDWSKSNLFRSQQTIETNQLESSSTTSQHNASTNTASSINKMISLESAEYRNDALFTQSSLENGGTILSESKSIDSIEKIVNQFNTSAQKDRENNKWRFFGDSLRSVTNKPKPLPILKTPDKFFPNQPNQAAIASEKIIEDEKIKLVTENSIESDRKPRSMISNSIFINNNSNDDDEDDGSIERRPSLSKSSKDLTLTRSSSSSSSSSSSALMIKNDIRIDHFSQNDCDDDIKDIHMKINDFNRYSKNTRQLVARKMQIIDKIEKQQLETTNRDNINDGIELTKSPHPHHHSHHSTTGNNHNESRLKRELLERKPLKLYLPNDNINVLGVKGFNRNSRVDCWSTIVANSLTEQSLHNTRQPSASSSSPSTSSSSAISLSCRECQMELIDCDECCSFCLAIELYKKKFCDECNRNDPDNSQRISASSDLNDDFILDEDCLANFKMSPSISMMNEKNDETRDKIGSLLHRIGKRFKWNSWWWNTRSSKLNGTYLLKRLRAGSQRLRGSKRFRASRKQKFQLNSTKNLPREGNETNDNLQKHNQRTKILRSRLHNDDEIMIDNVDDYRRQQNRKCFLNEKSVEENDIKTHHHNRNDFDGKFKLTNGTDVLDEKKQNKTMNNVDRHQNNLNGICKSDLIATAINKKEIASIINDKRIDDIQRNENCFDRKRLAQTNSSDKIRLFESSYSNVENGPECLKGKIDSIKPFFLSHPDRNEAKKFNDTKILEIGIQGISISSDSGMDEYDGHSSAEHSPTTGQRDNDGDGGSKQDYSKRLTSTVNAQSLVYYQRSK